MHVKSVMLVGETHELRAGDTPEVQLLLFAQAELARALVPGGYEGDASGLIAR
jgi:hypothetical protein